MNHNEYHKYPIICLYVYVYQLIHVRVCVLSSLLKWNSSQNNIFKRFSTSWVIVHIKTRPTQMLATHITGITHLGYAFTILSLDLTSIRWHWGVCNALYTTTSFGDVCPPARGRTGSQLIGVYTLMCSPSYLNWTYGYVKLWFVVFCVCACVFVCMCAQPGPIFLTMARLRPWLRGTKFRVKSTKERVSNKPCCSIVGGSIGPLTFWSWHLCEQDMVGMMVSSRMWGEVGS